MSKFFLLVWYCIFANHYCAYEANELPPIEFQKSICNFLVDQKIIETNYCIDEVSIGFRVDTFPENHVGYNAFFSKYIQDLVTEIQFFELIGIYGNLNEKNQQSLFSNKKIHIVYKPIMVNSDYFVMIKEIEKNTSTYFLVHFKYSNNKFTLIKKTSEY